MLNWLFGPRKPRGARRRGFFVFRTPQGVERAVDPFVVYRRLVHHETINLEKHATAADLGEEPETTELIEAICEIFGVTRYDETTKTGYLDWELLNLLGEYHEFLADLKKNIDTGLNSQPPTEPKSSESTPTPPEETTEDSRQPCTSSVSG